MFVKMLPRLHRTYLILVATFFSCMVNGFPAWADHHTVIMITAQAQPGITEVEKEREPPTAKKKAGAPKETIAPVKPTQKGQTPSDSSDKKRATTEVEEGQEPPTTTKKADSKKETIGPVKPTQKGQPPTVKKKAGARRTAPIDHSTMPPGQVIVKGHTRTKDGKSLPGATVTLETPKPTPSDFVAGADPGWDRKKDVQSPPFDTSGDDGSFVVTLQEELGMLPVSDVPVKDMIVTVDTRERDIALLKRDTEPTKFVKDHGLQDDRIILVPSEAGGGPLVTYPVPSDEKKAKELQDAISKDNRVASPPERDDCREIQPNGRSRARPIADETLVVAAGCETTIMQILGPGDTEPEKNIKVKFYHPDGGKVPNSVVEPGKEITLQDVLGQDTIVHEYDKFPKPKEGTLTLGKTTAYWAKNGGILGASLAEGEDEEEWTLLVQQDKGQGEGIRYYPREGKPTFTFGMPAVILIEEKLEPFPLGKPLKKEEKLDKALTEKYYWEKQKDGRYLLYTRESVLEHEVEHWHQMQDELSKWLSGHCKACQEAAIKAARTTVEAIAKGLRDKGTAEEVNIRYRECLELRVAEFLKKLYTDDDWKAKRDAIESDAREESTKRLLDNNKFVKHELTQELPVAGGGTIPMGTTVIVPQGFVEHLYNAPQTLLTAEIDERPLGGETLPKGGEGGVQMKRGQAPRPPTKTK